MKRPEHVGRVLEDFLAKAGLGRALAEWRVLEAWPDIVGPQLASHARAVQCRDGVLWVKVPSSTWRQHLIFLKPRILEKIRRDHPRARVKEIRLVSRWSDEQGV